MSLDREYDCDLVMVKGIRDLNSACTLALIVQPFLRIHDTGIRGTRTRN